MQVEAMEVEVIWEELTREEVMGVFLRDRRGVSMGWLILPKP